MQAKQYEAWPLCHSARAASQCCRLTVGLRSLRPQERILKLQDALELQKLKNTCETTFAVADVSPCTRF